MNKKALAEYAQKHQACKPGLKQILLSANETELIELYKKNIDFCLSENFPDLDYMSKVKDTLLIKHGIFLDGETLVKDSDFIVLLGTCFTGIEITGYNTSQIYLKHSAKADILAQDNAFVVIDCFDDTLIKIEATGNAKVLINVYGNAAVSSNQSGNAVIKVVNKGVPAYK